MSLIFFIIFFFPSFCGAQARVRVLAGVTDGVPEGSQERGVWGEFC